MFPVPRDALWCRDACLAERAVARGIISWVYAWDILRDILRNILCGLLGLGSQNQAAEAGSTHVPTIEIQVCLELFLQGQQDDGVAVLRAGQVARCILVGAAT